MPGGRYDPRPLPIDPGWTVTVWCPHGLATRQSLDLVRSPRHADWLVDPCPQAREVREAHERARAARAARREQSELHQLWLAWRFRRQIRRGAEFKD